MGLLGKKSGVFSKKKWPTPLDKKRAAPPHPPALDGYIYSHVFLFDLGTSCKIHKLIVRKPKGVPRRGKNF